MMTKDAPTNFSDSLLKALSGFADGQWALRTEPEARLLKQGFTNTLWRLRSTQVDWVVGLGNGSDSLLALNRCAELEVLRAVSVAGLAPTLVYAKPEEAVLVTTYVIEESPDSRQVSEEGFLLSLGRRMRELHDLPRPANLQTFDLQAALDHYMSVTPGAGSVVARAVVERVIADQLPNYRPARWALCHHDLHRDNIRLTNPLSFIDWEYAGWGNPLMDLAGFIGSENLSNDSVVALLEGYGDAAGLTRASLACTLALTDCLRVLWLDAAQAWRSVPTESQTALQARLLSCL